MQHLHLRLCAAFSYSFSLLSSLLLCPYSRLDDLGRPPKNICLISRSIVLRPDRNAHLSFLFFFQNESILWFGADILLFELWSDFKYVSAVYVRAPTWHTDLFVIRTEAFVAWFVEGLSDTQDVIVSIFDWLTEKCVCLVACQLSHVIVVAGVLEGEEFKIETFAIKKGLKLSWIGIFLFWGILLEWHDI